MLAAENDALPKAKVGGIGDVLRDVPPALVELGCRVTVIIPGYGHLAEQPGAEALATFPVNFAGSNRQMVLYAVPTRPGYAPSVQVRHWVLEHPLFSLCGSGSLYCDDPPGRPFARDATKFALFCAAAAELLVQGHCEMPEVIHLHDWHTAFFLLLRRCRSRYWRLQSVRCVFTIHNLALQGVRPLGDDPSSLARWFPDLNYPHALVADPRWPHCINPIATGIRLADAVHTVSPTYASEILYPSAVEARGYYGGEGLERDLAQAQAQNRLHGILNGCDYADIYPMDLDWSGLVQLLNRQILAWAGRSTQLASSHFIALNELNHWLTRRPDILMTSIGRLTSQKVRLLVQPCTDGRSALEHLLDVLGDQGLLILLGSGNVDYQQFFTEIAGQRSNFLFLCGYSDTVSQALYAMGDLFLMPSSFEPCGISQMLAMRAGQPCLVRDVGGLHDTVNHGVNGFVFSGDSLIEQAENLVIMLHEALKLRRNHPERWHKIADNAAAARFLWADSAQAYITQLYGVPE